METEKKTKEEGYVLGYLMAVLMVCLVFVFLSLSLSAGYYRQIIRERDRKQAELTSRTVAELVVSKLSEEEDQALSSFLLDAAESQETLVQSEPIPQLGQCFITVNREEDRLYLTVESVVNESKSSLTAILHWENVLEEGGEDGETEKENWYLERFCP